MITLGSSGGQLEEPSVALVLFFRVKQDEPPLVFGAMVMEGKVKRNATQKPNQSNQISPNHTEITPIDHQIK